MVNYQDMIFWKSNLPYISLGYISCTNLQIRAVSRTGGLHCGSASPGLLVFQIYEVAMDESVIKWRKTADGKSTYIHTYFIHRPTYIHYKKKMGGSYHQHAALARSTHANRPTCFHVTVYVSLKRAHSQGEFSMASTCGRDPGTGDVLSYQPQR